MTRTMKDSGIEWIGQIPEDWNLIRLQFCLNEIKEKNLPVKSEQVLSLVKDKGVMPYEEKGNVGNVAKEDISEYKLAYPNTLILNSMNILIGSVGISKYFGCVSPVYYVFKETEMSDLRFINYICTTNEFQKELRKYAKGIMEIRLRVSAQDIFKRIIAYPNKQEQIKIADFLDKKCSHIDSILEKTKASIDECKQLKQSVITQAVTKGIRPNRPMKYSGIEWIGEIPKDWETIKLKSVVDYNTDTLAENTEADYEFDYIEIGSVEFGKGITSTEHLMFKTAPSRARRIVKKDDVILSTVRTYLKAVAQIPEHDIQMIASTGFIVLTAKNEYITPEYLYYSILSSNFISLVEANSVGISYPAINSSLLVNYKITYPSIDEQKQISDYLDNKCTEIDKLITKKEKLIEELETYKKSLIYEYVTGKKEVI